VYVAGDNVDLTITPTYMTSINQRKSIHWFMNLLIEKRVCDYSLPNSGPQDDILAVKPSFWLPSDEEVRAYDHSAFILFRHLGSLCLFQRTLVTSCLNT
jgi:hypothetical protein